MGKITLRAVIAILRVFLDNCRLPLLVIILNILFVFLIIGLIVYQLRHPLLYLFLCSYFVRFLAWGLNSVNGGRIDITQPIHSQALRL